jgi:hypothetical protein
MDGVLLVFDSRTLPNLHALATVSAPMPEKTARRNRMVPAFATLILMLAVASIYYVSTMRNARQNFPPASVTTTATEVPAIVPPAPTPASEQALTPVSEAPAIPATQEAATPATEETAKVGPRATHAPAATQPEAAPARKATTTTKPATTKTEPKKDDSKVESILKKTGRILKKPFKF